MCDGGAVEASVQQGEDGARTSAEAERVWTRRRHYPKATHPIVLSLYLSKLFVTNLSTMEDLPVPLSPSNTTLTC